MITLMCINSLNKMLNAWGTFNFNQKWKNVHKRAFQLNLSNRRITFA